VPIAWLDKAEVNASYYNAVGGAVYFGTEAMTSMYLDAVARLVARHAAGRGIDRIRVIEVGANDCAFATGFLERLEELVAEGWVGLERIDYLAVDFSRGSLEAALAKHAPAFDTVRPGAAADPKASPEQAQLVGLLSRKHQVEVTLALAHADAVRFAERTRDTFDVAIANELLDDLPAQIHYADPDGTPFALTSYAGREGAFWRVRVDADEAAPPFPMPPDTIAAHSAESVRVAAGLARALAPGGLLLAHDYGYPGPTAPAEQYRRPQNGLPDFVHFDAARAGLPLAAFRVYGNERLRVVQITTDVNFAELADTLRATGSATLLAHGNGIVYAAGGRPLVRGDGVFLSELGLLRRDEDVGALLALLHRKQRGLRERYVATHANGMPSVFWDLVYVKDT
jgi:SAM-dependent MidA family methyltransferase